MIPGKAPPRYILERPTLDALFTALRRRAWTLVGPTVRDGAILYDEIAAATDLPVGWTDEQDGGTYRLKRRADAAVFGYVVGPQSWKRFLFPPTVRLWHARRATDGFQVLAENDAPPRFAFIGVRAYELHAIAVQDKVLFAGPHVVQVIMLAAPTTHFVMLAQAILYRGAGISVVWPQFITLGVIGVALFVPSLARFRKTIGTMA